MKASDFIAAFLAEQGVTHVYELVGGMITHLLDSLHQDGRVRIVSMHHEQAAGFAAEAHARMTGVPGVAMATSGPGATNLLTAIGSCYFDSSPAVFITGQVNRDEQKGDRAIRQLGFQETDIVAIAGPITKAAWRVQSAEDLPRLLAEAFTLAISGRPGPVLLDIPMDVQRMQVSAPIPSRLALQDSKDPDLTTVAAALDALRVAERPLILAGGGIRSSGALDLFRRLLEKLPVPVVNSLMAVDVLPYDHPLRVGMIGSYGNRWANQAVGRSDAILVLGSRLDIRQTGADTKAFKANRAIYHVDCEAGELNNRVVDCIPAHMHLRSFLTAALQVTGAHVEGKGEWQSEIAALRCQWPDTAELGQLAGINPNLFIHHLSRSSRSASAFVVDVGQHQMWAAQSLELGATQRFLTSGGMGAMGFALPSSIGAAFAQDRPVVVIAGDGGIQLNIQELQTIVRNQLPIKIVLLNNQCHGMVRQFQQSYFDERYQSTFWGYSAPDFASVAGAYGIDACTAHVPGDVEAALTWLWRDPTRPALLQVMIDTFANAYPKLAFGLPITEMEPFAIPVGMEST